MSDILRYFEYGHLPPHLQEVSRPVSELALRMKAELLVGPELEMGLRKLLEAKDCFVRARLDAREGIPREDGLTLLCVVTCAEEARRTSISSHPTNIAWTVTHVSGDVTDCVWIFNRQELPISVDKAGRVLACSSRGESEHLPVCIPQGCSNWSIRGPEGRVLRLWGTLTHWTRAL